MASRFRERGAVVCCRGLWPRRGATRSEGALRKLINPHQTGPSILPRLNVHKARWRMTGSASGVH
eukprot:543952-Pyramimonas_sp.AAC.1